MGLRKGKCYRKVVRAYTRKSKFKRKAFIKTIPPMKIVKFQMGSFEKKFDFQINFISKDPLQVRQNAIESARIMVNRHLARSLGPLNYYFRVTRYPHHVLRENKMLTGAHADRMQTGMQHSFGIPVGLAVQLKKNEPLFYALVYKKDLEKAKLIVQSASPRLPGRWIVNSKPLVK